MNTIGNICSKAVAQWRSVKKGGLRNFVKLTGKHLSKSLFFSKVTGSASLLKTRL